MMMNYHPYKQTMAVYTHGIHVLMLMDLVMAAMDEVHTAV